MKKLTILILFATFGLSLFSQVGYMGKRFLVNADVRVTPSWLRPNASGEKGYTKFDYFLEPGIEFIVNNRSSVGATYLNTKGMFPVWLDVNATANLNPGNLEVNYYKRISDNTFNSNGIGLFYKHYLWDSPNAPMGDYVKFEVDYFMYNYTVNQVNFEYFWSNSPSDIKQYPLYHKEQDKSSLLGAKIEFGHDFLFANSIRLSVGMSFGLTFGGFASNYFKTDFKPISEFADSGSSTPYLLYWQGDDIKYRKASEFVNGQMLSMYWFGLKMGIGFLAF
ncbi:MAG: hypothetical protein LBV75_02780 [Paludibacter sp.]|jgi:hypothetical protein|nr:hypothetical protein [Paludibacter sp.]